MSTLESSHLLNLPLEIRNQIYETIFFGEAEHVDRFEKHTSRFEARKLQFAAGGLAATASNQIHPYRIDSKHQPRYDVAIFCANQQIREEAEKVFYGWSSFNLTSDMYGPGDYPSFGFLQALPRRYCRLIRRIEFRCFEKCNKPHIFPCKSDSGRILPLFDWLAFMKFLGQECTSLRSLVLWGFADGREGMELASSCVLGEQWVQAILQIKTLNFFDIHAIPRGKVRADQSCVPEFVRCLRDILYPLNINSSSQKSISHQPFDGMAEFPFMKLPSNVRNRVYRFVLLPANKQIHPPIKSWYDGTTQNAVPLFLTCRQIYQDAQAVLYGDGVFCSPDPKYDLSMISFLQRLPSHLSCQIRYLRVWVLYDLKPELVYYAARNLNLAVLFYVLHDGLIARLNQADIPRFQKAFGEKLGELLSSFKRVQIRLGEQIPLKPEALAWLTHECPGAR